MHTQAIFFFFLFLVLSTESGGPMRHIWCFSNEEGNKDVKQATTNFKSSDSVQRSNYIMNLWKKDMNKNSKNQFHQVFLEQ